MDVDDEMDLGRYLQALWRQRWVVVISIVVGGLVALAAVQVRTPVYRAVAEVLIEGDSATSVLEPERSSVAEAQQRVATELDLIRSRAVLGDAADALGRTPSASARAQGSSLVVEVFADDSSAERAEEAADSIAEAYVAFRRERTTQELNTAALSLHERRNQLDEAVADAETALAEAQRRAEGGEGGDAVASAERALAEARRAGEAERDVLSGQISELQSASALALRQGPTVVSPARADETPISPRPVRDVALGLVAGLVAGMALALLRDRLDDTIRSLREVEAMDLVVVGTIPTFERQADEGWVASLDAPRSAAAEGFRALRVGVQLSAVDHRLTSILVTSPAAAEGKSTTAANLAAVTAASGVEVTLVDADLRRPRQHQTFALAQTPGLTSAVVGEASLDEVRHPIDAAPRLRVVTAGTPPPNAAEFLGAAAAQRTLRSLVPEDGILVVDAPPVLPVADALVLASVCDGVVLVVSIGSTSRRALARSIERLDRTEARLLGVVVNRVAELDAGAYAYLDHGHRRWRRRG